MGKDYYKMQLDDGVKGNYSKFLEELGKRESAGDGGYQAVSKNNYLGKYQIGEIALCDSGYYSNTKRKQYMKTFRNGKRYSADRWDGKFVELKNLSIKSFDEFLGLKTSCPKDLEGMMFNPYVGNSGNIVPKVIGDANALKLCQTLQEDAIRCVHINTWKYIYVGLTKDIKTAKYKTSNDKNEILQFLKSVFKIGTTLTYNKQSFKITTSGIIAGGHLCGCATMIDFLLKGIEGRDGNGTSIFEYMQKFEGYNMGDLFSYIPINEKATLVPIMNGNTQSTVVKSSTDAANTSSTTNSRTAQNDVKESATGEIIIKDFNFKDYGLYVPDFITETGEVVTIDAKGQPENLKVGEISPQGNLVSSGASLKCTEGDASSVLSIASIKKVLVNEQPIALISDTKPGINIKPFGQCKSMTNPTVAAATAANKGKLKKMPCVPNTVGTWSEGLSYLLVGEAIVSDKSTCKCAYAGTISIEKGKEGQSFLGYKKAGESSKEDKAEDEKNKEETKKIPEAKKVVAVVDTSVDNTVNKVDGIFKIKKGDKGEVVKEINLRLMGFGCGIPNDVYDDTTVKIVKQFKTDYMKQSNADGTFVDMSTIEAIDKFEDEYPITEAEFEQMKCPCTDYRKKEPKILDNECSGFGKGRNGVALTTGKYTKAQKKWKETNDEAYNPYEYPGIHKGILWIFRASKLYLKKHGYSIEKISSGYRCWNNNYTKVRTSTNHMGKALDIIVKKPEKTITGPGNYDYLRSLIFVPDMKAQINWPNKNKISLEPSGEGLANDWIHLDIRTYDKKYLSDDYFTKSKDYIINPPKLKSLIK